LNNLILKSTIAASLLFSVNLYAEDGFDDEFEDEPIEIVKVETKKSKAYSIYGSVTASSNYSYRSSQITSAKVSTNTHFDYNFANGYKIKSTLKAYTDQGSNINNDNDVDLNEIFLQGSINSKLDIKIGRQIVVWGKSDNIRITDTINPMDMTTPGMVDIKDLRLGRFISKADYFLNNKWSISTMLLHENRYSTIPEFGSEYTTDNKNFYNMKKVEEPSNSLDNTGFAASLSGNLSGQDIAFYLSNQYIDNTTYRSNMLGAAYNKVIDSFLLKTEVAYFDNYDSDTIDSKIDSLAGVEYNGINDGSISFELANKNNTTQYSVRFNQSYLNQTLDFTTLYSEFSDKLFNDGFVRSWVDYDIDDKLTVSFGIIDYMGSDDPQFKLIKDNDRVFTSLIYNYSGL